MDEIVSFFSHVWDSIPVFAGLSSLIVAILSILLEFYLTYKQDNEEKNVQIKINNRKIKLDGYTEDEVIELLERELSVKKQTQANRNRRNNRRKKSSVSNAKQ